MKKLFQAPFAIFILLLLFILRVDILSDGLLYYLIISIISFFIIKFYIIKVNSFNESLAWFVFSVATAIILCVAITILNFEIIKFLHKEEFFYVTNPLILSFISSIFTSLFLVFFAKSSSRLIQFISLLISIAVFLAGLLYVVSYS